jgi:hypothetical protein
MLVSRNPKWLLFSAVAFGAAAIIGFASLLFLWGKLDYGFVGYAFVWGPFIALFFAALFSKDYLVAKRRSRAPRLDSGAIRP